MKYSDKLKDPRWQKMRLEVFSRAGFSCEHCFADSKTLHAHHNYYVSGREPWEYPKDSISCLCKECHEIVTLRNGMEISPHDDEALVFPEWEQAAALALECERHGNVNGGETITDTIYVLAESSGFPQAEVVNFLNILAYRHSRTSGGLIQRLIKLQDGGVL